MSYEKLKILESAIIVNGNVIWNDGRRRITLKRPLRDIFEPLETDDRTLAYAMELYFNNEKIIERVRELFSQGVVPLLLYFSTKNTEEDELKCIP